MPVIWGQEQSYLVKQLRDFRNGERDSAIMSPITKGLAEGDLRKIAAYFAPNPGRSVRPQTCRAAKTIAQCQACHQPNFQGGNAGAAARRAQYEYLVAAMRAFATEERTNNSTCRNSCKC